jgi:3-isopropylmalate/(R)-2-methylmalate dehydratase small subunit
MEPFIRLEGIAAPLPQANVDTDKIIPARFMKTIQRAGLGKDLFHALRYEAGREREDFVLNRKPYRHSRILVAYENFGCGSSREHAPWALFDFGIRCVIAPGFADIFHANCFKNGILPVQLPRAQVDVLMADAQSPETALMTVDLEANVVRRTSGDTIPFQVDPFRRDLLLKGFDDISLTLQHAKEIDEFERRRASRAALFPPVKLPAA